MWFPLIDAKVKKTLDVFLPCQSVTTDMPPTPWHTVHIAFLGPFLTGEYLSFVIVAYSRYPEVDVIRSTAASALIPKLDRIFSTHADNGPPFNGCKIRKYMKIHGVEFTTTTHVWPQRNSEVESLIKPLLKAVLTARTEGRNWKRKCYATQHHQSCPRVASTKRQKSMSDLRIR